MKFDIGKKMGVSGYGEHPVIVSRFLYSFTRKKIREKWNKELKVIVETSNIDKNRIKWFFENWS